MGRRRRTSENGVISIKSLGRTPMNVDQNNHWWMRSKTRSRTLIHNLIMKNTGKGQIIDADPTAIVATTTIRPEEPTDPKEGE